jgi:hypothetical protein
MMNTYEVTYDTVSHAGVARGRPLSRSDISLVKEQAEKERTPNLRFSYFQDNFNRNLIGRLLGGPTPEGFRGLGSRA